MDVQAVKRLAQRGALIAIAEALHAMFQQGTYWKEKRKALYVEKDHTEECKGHLAIWRTTIGINANLQERVEWVVHFRRQPLGTITIKFHDGELRTIIWHRVGIGTWQLNTLWQEDPPVIEEDVFYHLVGILSTATARYVKRYLLPHRGIATHLLKILD